MRKLKLLAALSVAAAIFIAGCKKDEYQEKTGVCPLVVSTVPADNAIDIPLGQIITATFNENMDPATINEESFIIQQGTTAVAGTVAYSGMSASFTPSSPLLPDVLYSGTIKTLAADLLGQTLQQDHPWSFTSIAEVALSSSPTEGGTTSGAGLFTNDSTIIMEATANEGYSFVNWTLDGTPVSTDANYEFAMDGNKALVANFSLLFVVGLSSNPAEGGTTTGEGTYDTGAEVTVTAIPNDRYTFINWTEGETTTVVSTDTTYAFQVAASINLVANFESDTYTLNVTAENGTVMKDPEMTDYNSGEIVVLTAEPLTGYVFTGWTGDETGTQNPLSVTMNSNKNITANFSLQFVVGLSSNPAEGGTTTGEGAYDTGAEVTVTAISNDGYTFINWTEGETTTVVSTDATYAFQVAASINLVANFESDTYTLNVTAENGTVMKDPEMTDYNSGEIVVLTAEPLTGYIFTEWTGDETGTQNPLSVTMNSNKNITANFTEVPPNTFTLNVISLNGSVLKNPESVSYNSGDIVELTATPNDGYTFTGWSDDASGSDNPLSVTMNSDMNITANFAGQYPAGVNLGSAGNFAVLAGAEIANTGVSTYIIGDVGSFPTGTVNGLLAGNVDGILYTTADPVVGIAQNDLTTAYNDAQSRSLNAISLPGQLGGLTLAPGLYVNSSTSGISGTGPNGILTLDAGGDANAVWIFKMGSTFITDAGTSVVLAGGAQAKNIYWSVGTSATLGTNSTLYGNILADQAITLTTGATLNGRALTRIAGVTLDSNEITKPNL
ncbi:InlB B-repeat-containing protein [Sunxiuqinia indica]|uniref:InlB B-repeat-containing protein n=1 Tax=Sunxiuqinia indica TaxID=2692584 RepID=UPI0013569923|nr:ice-binding family protein [Sunxiuqinia indica]